MDDLFDNDKEKEDVDEGTVDTTNTFWRSWKDEWSLIINKYNFTLAIEMNTWWENFKNNREVISNK